MIDPFSAIATFGLGLIKNGQLQGWCRLAASLIATAFVTFFGTFGIAVVGLIQTNSAAPLTLGLAYASISMSVAVLSLWLRSPLTKGIPILYPGKIESARLKELGDSGEVYNPNDQKR